MTRIFAVLVLSGLLVSTPALAAPLNHGDFHGTSVSYMQVTEDALSPGDSTPLFGAPTITGDSLDFDPVSFSASASGAGGVDTTAGNVEFDVLAKSGFSIDTLTFTEAGNTTLAGFGTDSTFTQVTATLVIDIEEVDGAPFTGGPINYTDALTFTPSGGDFGLATDGAGGPAFSQLWTGQANVNIGQILADNNVSSVNGATKVTVTLVNSLVALSEDGTQAFISKQDVDGNLTVTANVPEPGAFSLLALLAGSALGLRGGRKA